MARTGGDATYTMGRSEGETDRLIEQAHLYEKMTLRMLRDAGVVRGMKVLDVGSGAGDVAFAAAGLVGSEGSVTGVDVNPAILDTARAGAAGRPFPGRIHRRGRPHPGSPERLRRGHRAAGADVPGRPGGGAEGVRRAPAPRRHRRLSGGRDDPLPSDPEPGYAGRQQAGRVGTGGVQALRGQHRHGPGAAARVRGRRPAVAVAHLEAPAGAGPDWAGYPYLQQGFASLLPLIESFGIATAAEVGVETLAERLRREAATSGRLIVLPPHVTAYARLPA